MLDNFFIGDVPLTAMTGVYNPFLVLVSYVIASLGSFSGLMLASSMFRASSKKIKNLLHFGGALALGSGIWSMHFIGMLAYKMDMPMSFEPLMTILSLLIAIFIAGAVLYVIRLPKIRPLHIATAAVLLGLAICSMHYVGMEAMKTDAVLRYRPALFLFSVAIAIFASGAALWIVFYLGQRKDGKNTHIYRIIASLIMGIAVCGMHYTGMAAAVFIGIDCSPSTSGTPGSNIDFDIMAWTVTIVSSMVSGLSLALSVYHKDFENSDAGERKDAFPARLLALSLIITLACLFWVGIYSFKIYYAITYNAAQHEQITHLQELAKGIYFTLHFTLVTGTILIIVWFFAIRSLREWRKELVSTRSDLTHRYAEKEKMEEKMRSHVKMVQEAHKRAMKATEEAEQANNAKTDFLATMSHELRTPMNGIIGLNELLLETDLSNDQKELASAVYTSSRSLLILLNDILDISKIEGGELTLESIAFDLLKTIDETVNLLSPIASRKGVVLDKFIDPSTPYRIKGDPIRLQQIFSNLIGNAIKFTEAGHVKLSISCELEGQKNFLLICVEDTGIGIPKDKHDMIFAKFSQADVSTTRKYGGSGLGLTITRQLVEVMGGKIYLESIVGAGTTFYVWLPVEVVQDTKSESGKKTETDNGVSYRTDVSILVVDDHPVNLLLMRKVLRKLGFEQVDEATSGGEALKMVQAQHYNLILMDCQMPEMDGFEATRRIREAEASDSDPMNIVAITADAMKGARDKCLQAGMNDYISKPINMSKLQTVLNAWLPHGNQSAVDLSNSDLGQDGMTVMMNWDILQMFTEGDPQEKDTLINLFTTYAEESIAIMKNNCNVESDEIWKKAAHRLKGSAANLGALKLSEVCAMAEEVSAGTPEEKTNILAMVEENYHDLRILIMKERLPIRP